MSAQSIQGDHKEREQNLVTKVLDLEDVLQVGEHRGHSYRRLSGQQLFNNRQRFVN